MKTLDQILAEHRFFKGLEPQYLELIAGCSMNVVFDAGRYIFREGQNADRFYLIRHGQVAVETQDHRRGQVIVYTLHEDDVLGWSWLFPPYKWHFDARAVTLTRAIALDGKCLRDKCDSDHTLGYELMQRFALIMMNRLHRTRLQVLDVYS